MPKTRFKSRSKANYAVRLNAAKNQLTRDQIRMVVERNVKLMILTAHKEFGFGKKRCERFLTAYLEMQDKFADDVLDVDATYADGSIDRQIEAIFGKEDNE